MALDPDLAEAHVAHALALHHAGRVQEAASEYEGAIALNPNLFDAFYHLTESAKRALAAADEIPFLTQAGIGAQRSCHCPGSRRRRGRQSRAK